MHLSTLKHQQHIVTWSDLELVAGSELLQPIHYHPSQINNVQYNHHVAQRRGQPACRQQLINAPENERTADNQSFKEV